jgi:hypothetical protein
MHVLVCGHACAIMRWERGGGAGAHGDDEARRPGDAVAQELGRVGSCDEGCVVTSHEWAGGPHQHQHRTTILSSRLLGWKSPRLAPAPCHTAGISHEGPPQLGPIEHVVSSNVYGCLSILKGPAPLCGPSDSIDTIQDAKTLHAPWAAAARPNTHPAAAAHTVP